MEKLYYEMEIVNEKDKERFYNHCETYYFGLCNERSFKVYASKISDGLEILGEYCKEKGYTDLLSFDSYEHLLLECGDDKDIFERLWFYLYDKEYYLKMPNNVRYMC